LDIIVIYYLYSAVQWLIHSKFYSITAMLDELCIQGCVNVSHLRAMLSFGRVLKLTLSARRMQVTLFLSLLI